MPCNFDIMAFFFGFLEIYIFFTIIVEKQPNTIPQFHKQTIYNEPTAFQQVPNPRHTSPRRL